MKYEDRLKEIKAATGTIQQNNGTLEVSTRVAHHKNYYRNIRVRFLSPYCIEVTGQRIYWKRISSSEDTYTKVNASDINPYSEEAMKTVLPEYIEDYTYTDWSITRKFPFIHATKTTGRRIKAGWVEVIEREGRLRVVSTKFSLFTDDIEVTSDEYTTN